MIEIQFSIAPDALKAINNLTEAIKAFAQKKQDSKTAKAEKTAPEKAKPIEAKPTEETKQVETKPIQEQEQEQTQSSEELREAITTLLRRNLKTKTREMKALLTKYGANKVSALTDEQLAPFLTELKKVVTA